MHDYLARPDLDQCVAGNRLSFAHCAVLPLITAVQCSRPSKLAIAASRTSGSLTVGGVIRALFVLRVELKSPDRLKEICSRTLWPPLTRCGREVTPLPDIAVTAIRATLENSAQRLL
jgi:hypothetical protein